MKKYILLLSLPFIANAQIRKIETIGLSNGQTIEANIIQKALTKKDLSFSDIVLEKTTIAEIINKYGNAYIQKTGDASTSNASVCYVGKDDSVITFSSGEMGGGEIVTAIEIFYKNDENAKNCVKSDKHEIPTSNNAGIKLGLTKKELIKKFGKPSYTVNNTLNYIFNSKLNAPKCDGGWDISESYTFKLKANKVISFSISKITSC
jgi:hypothetical protein